MDCSPGAVNISIALRDELVKAAKHIQKLESQNAEKDARIQQLETERDAAVRDLKALCGCMACDHAEKDYDSAPCNECTNCNGEVVESKWQWRGVQKEN